MLLTPLFFVDLRAGQDNLDESRTNCQVFGGPGLHSIHMFVESCMFNARSRATRSEHMLKNTAFYSIYAKNMIYDENTVIGLAQFLLGSNHMEFEGQ